MKKMVLTFGGALFILLAAVFAVTGWDELWNGGKPWVFGFFCLTALLTMGVLSLWLSWSTKRS